MFVVFVVVLVEMMVVVVVVMVARPRMVAGDGTCGYQRANL